MASLKIKKGDTVKVIAGKDKDKEGKVIAVDPKKNTVLVEGMLSGIANISGNDINPLALFLTKVKTTTPVKLKLQ